MPSPAKAISDIAAFVGEAVAAHPGLALAALMGISWALAEAGIIWTEPVDWWGNREAGR